MTKIIITTTVPTTVCSSLQYIECNQLATLIILPWITLEGSTNPVGFIVVIGSIRCTETHTYKIVIKMANHYDVPSWYVLFHLC